MAHLATVPQICLLGDKRSLFPRLFSRLDKAH